MAKLANASDLSSDEETLVGSTPSMPTSAQILALYPEFHTVYGPYKRADNRSVYILYGGHKRSARQCAKVIMEVHLGRRLTSDETIDHIDCDVTNDAIENLQVLTCARNASRNRQQVFKHGNCANCGKVFALSREQLHSRAKDPTKHYCSFNRRGAGSHNR